ncbi:phosphoenolpyruvate phosphomutase-domain-containing protein [Dactylonectria estremocensis]|uniref:Phosphoenolpyruvate phosphomutase-domain-containing protein n=1 Tax=Dactylonectria estremocensis TaxID=1079267 RepID=A0A9P9D7E6_9HYPO|nr:phosphoenolpyruvate phosphomutase-domain-containing protein [Dactylonectria estremocensis]
MGSLHHEATSLPSFSSVRSTLAQNNNRIILCESHDGTSTEIIRSTVGSNGQRFHGIWYSGLCQTTYLGIPDSETLSPLQRASLLALDGELKRKTSNRPLCAAFDADSGGDIADIPALVALLNLVGVGMIVIEDKAVSAPGQKVNSLATASASQALADPNEFAQAIRTFKAATAKGGPMVTARIESFCCRVAKSDPEEEAKSYEEAHQDALKRARIYHEAGVDAIMIHSKSKSPSEVIRFLREYREFDFETPLVVVPTTYSEIPKDDLYDAGANVVIYANHLMRAKISAVSSISERILSQNLDLFYNDDEVRAIVKARNYGCLLRKLRSRSYWGEESNEARMYRIVAEAIASQNIQATVLDLLQGKLAGCEADTRIVTVKELLAINAKQVVSVADLVGQVDVY